MHDIPRTPLQGRRVLVVEDEYVLAEDLCRALDAQGARVLGPASQVRAALELLARGDLPDLAILDVNLGGEMVFPVADALRRLGIPFVFATEYGHRQVPSAHADQGTVQLEPRCPPDRRSAAKSVRLARLLPL